MDVEGLDDRARPVAGALLGTFAGDALGAPFEGGPPADDRDGARRLATSLADGLTYTDDTQLALALAAHLCDHPAVDPAALAARILDEFEPWRGYGGGMRGLVAEWGRRTPLDADAVAGAATSQFPEGSFGNGAAMRIAAVGVRWAHDAGTLDTVARRSAELTHVHPLGVEGAVLQARAVALGTRRRRFGRNELAAVADGAVAREYVDGLRDAVRLARAWSAGELTYGDVATQLGTSVVAHRSVPAALWAAATGDGIEEAIVLALGLGGDTDTIAAMAGAVVGAAEGVDALPPAWLDAMEDGPRGVTYALRVAAELARSIASG